MSEQAEIRLLAGFRLGAGDFGIEAHLVQEVVKPGEITPVHGAPAGVVGIRNLRGRIVTIVDLAVHLELGVVDITPMSRVLILDGRGDLWGLLVDSVTDTFDIDLANLEGPPGNLAPSLRGKVKGVWKQDEWLTAYLDVRTLFEDQEGGL